jgi:hypothetical protein
MANGYTYTHQLTDAHTPNLGASPGFLAVEPLPPTP